VGFFFKIKVMMFFDAISFYKKLLSPGGVAAMLKSILSQNEMKAFIIEMNQEQLYELGQDSKERGLGDYSPFTITIKESKGQRVDHITLRDEGTFYNSFTITVDDSGFTQDADGDKGGGSDLFRIFGIDILGLNEFNTERLREKLLEEIAFYIQKNAK
jgi:hypothetical protein